MMSYAFLRACVHVCAHVCAHVWRVPSHHLPPTSTHPAPPWGGPSESVKIQ